MAPVHNAQSVRVSACRSASETDTHATCCIRTLLANTEEADMVRPGCVCVCVGGRNLAK